MLVGADAALSGDFDPARERRRVVGRQRVGHHGEHEAENHLEHLVGTYLRAMPIALGVDWCWEFG